MNPNLGAMALLYRTALRRHLKSAAPGRSVVAGALARRAVALRMDTLSLARIHEGAVALQLPRTASGASAATRRRAFSLFTSVARQIELGQAETRLNKVELDRIVLLLRKRIGVLTASNRRLREDVARRKSIETRLERQGVLHRRRLEESLHLQSRQRQLTHRVISAQEDERRKLSSELQDEIAQTLLGINVRLISLTREARTTKEDISGGITNAQRVVARSVRSVSKVGRQLTRR